MPSADLVLANRSYLDHFSPPGGPEEVPAAGGLLAALAAVIAPSDGSRGTTWIGAARGPLDRAFVDATGRERLLLPGGELDHRRLFFDDATWTGHYVDVANAFLWPLLHLVRTDLPARAIGYPAPTPPPDTAWQQHVTVNRAFAEAALSARTSGTAWIHDYQLALVPGMLRAAHAPFRVGFFLHTPFPDLRLAHRYTDAASIERFAAFVRGMLGADLIGFQTHADLSRFRDAASALCAATSAAGLTTSAGRHVATGVFPVGIDCDAVLHALSQAPHSAARPTVLGLERCDFTKGIVERLQTLGTLHRAGSDFCYTGVSALTREDVPAFAGYARKVRSSAQAVADTASGAISQRFATLSWPDVVALEGSADVVFTSSVSDGMNLVPLQAAIAQSRRPIGQRAAIIAGRETGVVAAYGGDPGDGITSVDPLDPREMRNVLERAILGQLPRVSDRLIRRIHQHDARAWATGFLDALENHS